LATVAIDERPNPPEEKWHAWQVDFVALGVIVLLQEISR